MIEHNGCAKEILILFFPQTGFNNFYTDYEDPQDTIIICSASKGWQTY